MSISLQQAIEYSKANPTSDYAKKIGTAIKSGAFDKTAQEQGVDLSWAGRPKLQPAESSPVADTVIGAAKGIGSTALELGKSVVSGAAGLAMPGFTGVTGVGAPKAEDIPLVGDVVKKAEDVVTPSNTTQEKAFNTEQLAELLFPATAVGAKAVTKAPAFASALEKASLRLTPAMKRDLGPKIKQVTDFLLKNRVVGSPTERTSQVDTIYKNMETQLQKFLDTNNTAKGIAASRSEILSDLEALKSSYRDSRDYQAAIRQIDEAKALFEKGGTFVREKIPIARLNELKRTTFDGAYNKAGTKVLDDVERAIGGVFKQHIEDATAGLKIGTEKIADFNKEYGTVITARNLLRTAESRDEVGLVGKIISTLAGGSIGAALGGGEVGATAGLVAGNLIAPTVAGTAMRSNVAQIAAKIGEAAPAAAKILAPALGVTVAEAVKLIEKLIPVDQNQQQSNKEH